MLPMPETSVWSSRARLSPVRRRRSAAREGLVVERRVERVAGDVRHAARDVPPAPSGRAARRRARRRCAGRRSAAPGRRRRTGPHPQVRLVGGVRRLQEQLAAHAQVGDEASASSAVEREPEVLAAAATPRGPCVRAAGREVAAPAAWRRTARGCWTSDGGDRAAGHPAVEAAPDDLDLGQLGHRSADRRRLGAPQCVPGRRGRFLLGLLLAASDARAAVHAAPTRTTAVKVFSWSGPGLADQVLGDAEPEGGGELLQAGLPVQAGAERGRLRRSAGRRAGGPARRGRVEAAVEVDGADHRLEGVGEDRGLVAAAGGLLAAAERGRTRRGRARAPRRRARAC